MQLHPSLAHQLSLARQRDAEHAAAVSRRVGGALHAGRKKAVGPRSTAPICSCPEPARG